MKIIRASSAFDFGRVLFLANFLVLAPALHAQSATVTNVPSSWPSLKEVRQKWDARTLETVQQAAENGDLTAQHYLGFCCASGERVQKNGATAVKWYERAADAGYLPSNVNLGLLYQRGEVVPRDLARSLRYYRLATDAGLAQAQVNLGFLFRDGVGVSREPGEALKWFRLAAAQGHTTAMVEIGRAYRSGEGVEKDAREAIKWFEKAAAQGEPLAEMNLGLIFEDEGNLDAALKFYRQAAGHGSADAMFVLHNLYENGIGVAKDRAEAERWLLKGAAAGSPQAQTALGYHHESPGLDTGHRVGDQPASMAEAVKWYRRAAEQNWTDGQYRLASCYLEGNGVEKDEERGLQLMRAAADRAHARALVELAELYARGVGEPRNREDAPMELLQRAVKTKSQGPYGAYNRPFDFLVFRCEHGIGTARDLVAAAEWYVRAALAGAHNYSLEDKLDYAPSKRHALWTAWGHPERSTIQIALPGDSNLSGPASEVLALYLKAAQPNGGTNALKIAEKYLLGRDVPESRTKAWAWFNLAARHGASEGAAKCRALEQKLTPAEQAEARKQFDQTAAHLDEVRLSLRHDASPQRDGR